MRAAPIIVVLSFVVVARAHAEDKEAARAAFVDASRYYDLSHQWTASTYLSSNLGAARSERGSFAQRFSTIFQLTLYL